MKLLFKKILIPSLIICITCFSACSSSDVEGDQYRETDYSENVSAYENNYNEYVTYYSEYETDYAEESVDAWKDKGFYDFQYEPDGVVFLAITDYGYDENGDLYVYCVKDDPGVIRTNYNNGYSSISYKSYNAKESFTITGGSIVVRHNVSYNGRDGFKGELFDTAQYSVADNNSITLLSGKRMNTTVYIYDREIVDDILPVFYFDSTGDNWAGRRELSGGKYIPTSFINFSRECEEFSLMIDYSFLRKDGIDNIERTAVKYYINKK